jgi:hypothetical protein
VLDKAATHQVLIQEAPLLITNRVKLEVYHLQVLVEEVFLIQASILRLDSLKYVKEGLLLLAFLIRESH